MGRSLCREASRLIAKSTDDVCICAAHHLKKAVKFRLDIDFGDTYKWNFQEQFSPGDVVRLPYPEIVIETEANGHGVLVIAWETAGHINVQMITKTSGWLVSAPCFFENRIAQTLSIEYDMFWEIPEEERRDAYQSFQSSVIQVFNLIYALQHPGARIERQVSKHAPLPRHPRDVYHVLTIKDTDTQGESTERVRGPHHSPREHERRGHYRSLASGKKVWVGQCTVAKGAQSKVFKTYSVGA